MNQQPDRLAKLYPNNKPWLQAEKQLFDKGWAIECREPASPFGYTPVWCVNIFGIRQLQFIKKEASG